MVETEKGKYVIEKFGNKFPLVYAISATKKRRLLVVFFLLLFLIYFAAFSTSDFTSLVLDLA